MITDDPDIAREDGALFLGAGNPEIGKGAEAVVAAGDVGALTLPHSAKHISTEDLLAKIRDQIPVAHGRIDATSSILRSHRPVLRLAALVSHSVSADEQFTEVAECFLDVPSRVAWAQDAADRLLRAIGTAEAIPGSGVPANRLAPAVAAAHRELDNVAARRGRELSIEADAERVAEITRATEYYAAALAAIDNRRGGADAGRRALLDARAHATVAERDRRLAEINEKYRHQHVLRPYRLHLVDVPVWRLDTDVRRGERRWPMVFDYLPLLGVVAPTRCPTCGAHSRLVATKTHLVCEACTPATPSPVRLAPVVEKPQHDGAARNMAPTKTRVAPTPPAKRHPLDTSTADRKRRGVAPGTPTAPDAVGPAAARGPFVPGAPEERKVVDFWNQVGAGERRKLSRLIAPDSPLAALTRLYGAAGPLRGIGIPAGHAPVSFTSGHYDRPVAGERGGTAGELSHPPRPVPLPAAVVRRQAPGRDLPLLGAVAPGPRPDAAQATRPGSAAPHRPGYRRATPARPRRGPAWSDLRGPGAGRVVAAARSGRPARPVLPPRARRDRRSGHSLLVGSAPDRLLRCRRDLRGRPGRDAQSNRDTAEAAAAQQHPQLVSLTPAGASPRADRSSTTGDVCSRAQGQVPCPEIHV